MLDIFFFMFAFHMSIRIAGGSDAEIPLFADVADQFAGVSIMPWAGELTILRNIAAQRQHVFNAALLHFLQLLCDFLPGRGHACQVGQGWYMIGVLNFRSDLHCPFGGASSGTVSNADKIRLQLGNPMDHFFRF